MNGHSKYFTDYSGGIIDTDKCDKSTTHSVNIVGCGEEASKNPNEEPKKYFIIRNSWGTWWGDKGYARISAS